MNTYLIDYNKRKFELPTMLEWKFLYGSGTPSDAFELCFEYSAEMMTVLEDANEFIAIDGGKTVFHGVVDEFEVFADERGCFTSVRGRGLAARLLDNEVDAAQYYSISLDMILDRYVRPFGISDIRINASPSVRNFTVKSGQSAFGVLTEFLWFGCGESPRFDHEGRLVIGAEKGKRYAIDGKTGIFSQSAVKSRYGVISEVLVKNKAVGISQSVCNEDFIARGGRCRRVVNVPRRTWYDAMRSTGEYQLEHSKGNALRVEVCTGELFAVFPNDIVELSDTPLGIDGSFLVSECVCYASDKGAGTDIILTKQVD